MRIAIFTLGTRGDVQPYAVLGQALKKRGHEVVLSTGKNFEGLVQSYGLDFVPVEADFQALLYSEEGKKIRKNPIMARKYMKKFVTPMMANAFSTFYELARNSDKILFHIKTMADNFADQFPGKMIKADVIPASEPTSAFANPVFSAWSLPSNWNRLTYKFTEWGLKMWKGSVRDFRRKHGLPEQFTKPDIPSIYGISNHFLEMPSDYPPNAYFTGFWSGTSTQELDQKTMHFIEGGSPPLVITFGSMPFESKLNLPDVIKSVQQELKTRIVLIKGWGITETSFFDSSNDILTLDAAPYDKLFPRAKAVIHHGGIGTMAACLKAGKPFLTCPVLYPLGDQVFWGKIAISRKVGLGPLPLKKMKLSSFLDRVNELLHNDSLYHQARQLSEKIETEDGVANAISLIEASL